MSPPALPLTPHEFATAEASAILVFSSERRSWLGLEGAGRPVSVMGASDEALWRWAAGQGAACVVELPLTAEPPLTTVERLAGSDRPIVALVDSPTSALAAELLAAGATVVLSRDTPPFILGATLRRIVPPSGGAPPPALEALVRAMESLTPLHLVQRAYARYALERLRGNKVRAASVLQVDRRTLQRWERDARPAGDARADESSPSSFPSRAS